MTFRLLDFSNMDIKNIGPRWSRQSRVYRPCDSRTNSSATSPSNSDTPTPKSIGARSRPTVCVCVCAPNHTDTDTPTSGVSGKGQ